MNKFTKKNFMLVAVLVGSGVLAAALLIAAGIVWLDLLQRIGDTKAAREKVEKLTKAKPAPGDENERRIKHDIVIFQKAAKELRKAFGSPLEPAVEAFIKELQPPYAKQLTDEQHERFRIHPANEDEMSQEQIRNLKTRKLSVEDFRGLFQEAFENNPGSRDENQRQLLSTQNFFIMVFRRKFPNWNSALAKFVEKAKTLTHEPIGRSNDVALLLTAMGFPRAIPNEQEFIRHMESYRAALIQKAEAGKLEFMPAVANFMLNGSTNNSGEFNMSGGFAPADIREIFFHWDVLGDFVSLLCKSGVRTFHDLRARNFSETLEEGRKLGTYSETVGSYKLYHYSLEISGTLKSIRDFCTNLDNSYKNGRPYVVRAVTLYAEENGAGLLMGQMQLDKKDGANQDENNENYGGRRGRRGRRRQVVEVAESEKEQQVDPDELRAQEEARIKALPVHERPGYGAVLVGNGELFRAIIDVDYIILEQNQ